jgi:hypothetical protein
MSASALRLRHLLGLLLLLAVGFGVLGVGPAFSQKAPQVRVGTVLRANLPALLANHRHTLQWERCRHGNCRKIAGATSGRYRTRKADTGHGIDVKVAGWRNGRKQVLTMLVASSVVSAGVSTHPARRIKGYYDQGYDQLADWNKYKTYGFNLVFAGINTRLLDRLRANGASAWVQPNIWTGCGYEYSTSQALRQAKKAVATGAVSGFYVADEPSTWNCASAPAQIAAWTATLHAHFPGIPTILATYDATDLTDFAHSADEFALDFAPCQDGNGCDYSGITALAATADRLHLKYVGIPQAFGGDGRYDLPTPSQLKQIIHTWKATKELGYVVYAFSAVGMPSSTWLQNDPGLLSTIASN